MSKHAILLVLVSACMHAAWNVLSKAGGDPLSFLMRALAFSALLYAPLFLWLQTQVHYSATVLACVTASGMLAGVYFFCLGKAYKLGNVSVVYPVARSFPILVVTLGGLLLGECPSLLGLLGVLLVVAGCFVLPWQRFTRGPDGFCLANYRSASIAWALGSASCTAIYSILDKIAATSMSQAQGSSMFDKMNYVYIQNLISWVALAIGARFAKHKSAPVMNGRAFFCGAIFLISYSLILLALSTDPVAYVVSFRQFSIVLATIVSMLWIERSFTWPRLIGASTIFAGVLIIGLA